MNSSLTVVIVARNEAEELARCLKSLELLKTPVVVIDLESTDDTAVVAKKHGAKVIPHKSVEIVEEIREWSLKNVETEFVLFLDPDESLPETLAQEIITAANSGGYDYFEIPRKNIVFGSWLKNSRWWPDYQVRLFRKGAVKWPQDLHHQPVSSGNKFRFDSDEKFAIVHNNYRDLDSWFEKNKRYAKKDAKDRFESEEPFTITESIKLSVSELVSRFFAGEGYKDGMHGLLLAVLQAFYYFWVYAYYWELSGYRSEDKADTVRDVPLNWFRHGLSEILYWHGGKKRSIKSKLLRKLL